MMCQLRVSRANGVSVAAILQTFSFFAYTKLMITERLAGLAAVLITHICCSVTHRRCCELKSSGITNGVFMCFVLFSSIQLC